MAFTPANSGAFLNFVDFRSLGWAGLLFCCYRLRKHWHLMTLPVFNEFMGRRVHTHESFPFVASVGAVYEVGLFAGFRGVFRVLAARSLDSRSR